jgi:hypothetical protein
VPHFEHAPLAGHALDSVAVVNDALHAVLCQSRTLQLFTYARVWPDEPDCVVCGQNALPNDDLHK